MIKCPKCGEELEASFHHCPDNVDYVEVDLECRNEHEYFVRIREEDIMKV